MIDFAPVPTGAGCDGTLAIIALYVFAWLLIVLIIVTAIIIDFCSRIGEKGKRR